MSDTPAGETVDTQPKNDVTNPTPAPVPPVPKVEDNAVDDLRKQLEQAKMRENQLANQLKVKEDADAATKAKELEEQNQFKELYEQEKAKRESIESDAEAEKQKAELVKAKQEVLSAYNDEVKALAEEIGLDLTAADETAVNQFKEKLEKINTRVTSSGKVKGNNQPNANAGPSLNGEDLQRAISTEQGFHDLVTKQFPGIAAMTKPRQ